MHGRGEEVRIEFSSADATTAAAISLYDINGNSRAMGSGERLVILSLAIQTAASSTNLFDDANDNGNVNDGERLFSTSTTGFFNPHYLHEGMFCGPGRTPKVKGGSAAQINVTGHGYIIKA